MREKQRKVYMQPRDIAKVKYTGLSICGDEERGEPNITLRFCLNDSKP